MIKMRDKSFIKKIIIFALARDKKQIILGKLYPLIREYHEKGVRVVNIPGFFSSGDISACRTLVNFLTSGSLVIEVGTWKGRSLANVATVRKDIAFIGIDTFLGSKNVSEETVLSENNIYFQFLRNMLRHKVGNFSVLRLESTQAAGLFRNEIADLIFIDASHSYKEVKQDILSWRPKVKNGGILAGHDYRDQSAVARAAEETLGLDKIETFPESSVWAIQL